MTKLSRLIVAVVLSALAVYSTSLAGNSWWNFSHGPKFGPTEKGSGDLVTEKRDVAPFQEIKTSISVDMHVTVGQPQSVTIKFDDNLIGNIVTRVRGNTLIVEAKGSFSTESDCVIDITVPALEAVSCAGSGNIEVNNLKGDEFTFELNGSGTMTADGTVDQFYVDISGSGDVNARDLQAQDVEVDISGSGNAIVNAASSLDGEISGSGDIRYLGKPEKLSTHVSGSGSIRRGK